MNAKQINKIIEQVLKETHKRGDTLRGYHLEKATGYKLEELRRIIVLGEV